MIKTLLSFCLIAATFIQAFGQACTPDPQFTNPASQAGIYPDSVTNFDTAYVGVPYTQLITIVIPPDTQAFPPPFPPIAWDSTRLDSVSGLPASLSLACWNNNGFGSAAACMWKGNSIGCAIINGTPTAGDVGVHSLKFYTNNFVGGQTAGNPYVITYYKIVVLSAGGIDDNPDIQVVMQNIPNPFNDKTEIQFMANDFGIAHFKIFNLVGTLVKEYKINVKRGLNKLELNASDYESGIYFYSLSHGSNTFTRKMIVKR